MGTQFKFGMMKKLWKWLVVMIVQHCACTECHLVVHLKMMKMIHFMYLLPQGFKNFILQ